MNEARTERIVNVIAGVLRAALRDARARGVVLLDDGGACGAFAARCCEAAGELVRIEPPAGNDREAIETQRMQGRIEAHRRGALLAHPACKTELLLGDDFPPESLLPLGDLYASEVPGMSMEQLSPEAARVAAAAGGLEALDAGLRNLYERRLDESAAWPETARGLVTARLAATRFRRQRPGLIPKLGRRTLGIDLFA